MNCSAMKSTVSCKVAVAGGTVALGAHQSTFDSVVVLSTSHILSSNRVTTVDRLAPALVPMQSNDVDTVKSERTHSHPHADVDEGGRIETSEPVPQSAIFTLF